tara:strand:- start:1294 stop:2043 length:750 start_codon:yes stop_codon:yes gene_type:complete
MKYFRKKYSEVLFFFLALGTIIFLAVQWAEFHDLFKVKNVEINEIQYFNDSSLVSYKNEMKDNHIMFFDLKYYKDQIDSLTYVKNSKIWRTFPETINIAVYEREPIAMVNSIDLIMLDVDGICLPIEENSAISLPILSNFTTDQESYPLGRKTKSPNAIKSIDIIKYSKNNFNRLYEDISEFVFNENNEYEIILKNGKTKILLGSDDYLKKIDYLKAFASSLPDNEDFDSYQYIDLRYKDQIVVKERKT